MLIYDQISTVAGVCCVHAMKTFASAVIFTHHNTGCTLKLTRHFASFATRIINHSLKGLDTDCRNVLMQPRIVLMRCRPSTHPGFSDVRHLTFPTTDTGDSVQKVWDHDGATVSHWVRDCEGSPGIRVALVELRREIIVLVEWVATDSNKR